MGAVHISESQRAGSLPVPGRVRSPWVQWGLAVVTLGVFAAVHHYRVNRELRDFGVDVDPIRALLAVFPGVLLVVPFLVTVHRTCGRIAVAQEIVGLRPTIRAELGVVAALFTFLHVPYAQSELNRAWNHVEETR